MDTKTAKFLWTLICIIAGPLLSSAQPHKNSVKIYLITRDSSVSVPVRNHITLYAFVAGHTHLHDGEAGIWIKRGGLIRWVMSSWRDGEEELQEGDYVIIDEQARASIKIPELPNELQDSLHKFELINSKPGILNDPKFPTRAEATEPSRPFIPHSAPFYKSRIMIGLLFAGGIGLLCWMQWNKRAS